jgi:hypothetical protein
VSKNDKEHEAREQRFISYIKDGITAADIGQLEGLRADYAGRLRKAFATKHGLTITKGQGQDMPPGITEASRRFRGRLGDYLYKLLNDKKLLPVTVANRVGVPVKLQSRAYNKPNYYDWKLSELERLAKASGVPFEQFIRSLVENR